MGSCQPQKQRHVLVESPTFDLCRSRGCGEPPGFPLMHLSSVGSHLLAARGSALPPILRVVYVSRVRDGLCTSCFVVLAPPVAGGNDTCYRAFASTRALSCHLPVVAPHQ